MYSRKIWKTPPHIAYEVAAVMAQMVEWSKRAGNALHNVVCDKAFVSDPDSKDAQQQVIPNITAVTRHADAISRWLEIKPYLLAHLNDGKYAHYVADSANAALIIAPNPTDVATMSTALEQARQALNQHLVYDAGHNRIAAVANIATVADSEASNIQVLNSICKLFHQHVHSAAVSLVIEGT